MAADYQSPMDVARMCDVIIDTTDNDMRTFDSSATTQDQCVEQICNQAAALVTLAEAVKALAIRMAVL